MYVSRTFVAHYSTCTLHCVFTSAVLPFLRDRMHDRNGSVAYMGHLSLNAL
jgi:hypothetical protein